ncbi:MAG: MFS transporter [Allosphingosinicella sp.]
MAEIVAGSKAVPASTSAAEELRRTRLVIGASSAGTVFEWYDFFIYGTLAASGIIGRTYFPSGNETLQTLLAWAGFAIGFGFRPLGAILFGYMGDRLGRKTTFLVTITLMGIATAGVGLVPSAAAIGVAAPLLIILLRICQGLALGGEYGGAAIYVAEHSPPGKSGFYTSFIQASVVGGFILSLAVVLGTKSVLTTEAWDAWGWRFPFLFSILLLAVSLWMRLKLSESPVFTELKESGGCAANPFKASFTYPGNPKRLFVALFGIAAGLTVIWYTAMFSTLSLLQNTMRVEATTAQIIVGLGALLGCGWYILFGWLSDRVGRKRPIVIGYALTLLLLFPIYWLMGEAANPDRAAAYHRTPVTIHRAQCDFDPFAARQADLCGQILGELGRLGVQYQYSAAAGVGDATTGDQVGLGLGDRIQPINAAEEVRPFLEQAGYSFEPVIPSAGGIALILLALLAITGLSGMTYGPVAALLSEMFPPQIRYSSMSIPYHFGTGYFGGFQPFIASYIAASTGDPYSGLWYTWGVVAMALVVTYFWLPNDVPERGNS